MKKILMNDQIMVSASVAMMKTPPASPCTTAISSSDIFRHDSAKHAEKSSSLSQSAKRSFDTLLYAASRDDHINAIQVGANISSRGVSRGFVLLVLLRMNFEVRALREEGGGEEGKIQINSFSNSTVQFWFTEAIKDLLSDPSFEDAFCGNRYDKSAGQCSTRFDPMDTTTYWTHTNQLVSWWKNNVERKSKFNVLARDASYEGRDDSKCRRKIFCEVAILICSNTRTFFDRLKKKSRIDSRESSLATKASPIQLPIRLPQRCQDIGRSSNFSSSEHASAAVPCYEPLGRLSSSGSSLYECLHGNASNVSLDTVTTRESFSRNSFNGGVKHQGCCSEGQQKEEGSTNFDDFSPGDSSFDVVSSRYTGLGGDCSNMAEASISLHHDTFFSEIDVSHFDRRPIPMKSLGGSLDWVRLPDPPTEIGRVNDAIHGMVSDCDSMECSVSSSIDSSIENASASEGTSTMSSLEEFDLLLRTKFCDCSFEPIDFNSHHIEFDIGSIAVENSDDYEDFVLDWAGPWSDGGQVDDLMKLY